MDQTYMKEKPILPLLLFMAAPMILSMLVNSLYNIIDSIFVAQISKDAMTALSLVFPIQNFVNSVAVGFGIGINVMIAFCLGAGDQLHAHKAASQGFFLSIVHGILLSITGILNNFNLNILIIFITISLKRQSQLHNAYICTTAS